MSSKKLNELLAQICALTGQACNKEDAVNKGLKGFLWLDYSKIGGYRLVGVNVENGGHYDVFGFSSSEARKNVTLMALRLEGIVAGLEYVTSGGPYILSSKHVTQDFPE